MKTVSASQVHQSTTLTDAMMQTISKAVCIRINRQLHLKWALMLQAMPQQAMILAMYKGVQLQQGLILPLGSPFPRTNGHCASLAI